MVGSRTWLLGSVAWLALAASAQTDLSGYTVTISAQDQPIRAVLQELSRQTGLPIVVDERLADESVSLGLRNQPLSQALDILARGAGLVWSEYGGRVFFGLDPNEQVAVAGLGQAPMAALAYSPRLLAQPVTLRVVNVTLPDLVEALARESGVRMALHPSAPTHIRITAAFDAAPLSRALYLVGLGTGVYVRPGDERALVLHGPDRVEVVRSTGDDPTVVELYPDGYHGVLGYLLTDRFWQSPAAYRSQVRTDERGQPRVAPATG